MLFGKKDKKDKKDQPSQRVMDLKARVDALRQADEAARESPYSLDHFLEGDDVLTGRTVEDNYQPTGFSAAGSETHAGYDDGVDFEAELQKYLERQEALTQDDEPPPPAPLFPGEFAQARDAQLSTESLRPNPETPSWETEFPSFEAPPAPPPRPAWPEGPDAAWPSSAEWPSEDEWPPRREEAV